MSVSISIESGAAADVGHGAQRAHADAHDVALTARQSAQLQRARAYEQRVQSGGADSLHGSEQLQVEKSGGLLPKANVKQSSDLLIGG